MADVEIGRGKTGRRADTLDEIGIVPARRTRAPEEVSLAWQIDAYRFDLPLVACPMDSVVSPATAITIGKLGGLAVLDLEVDAAEHWDDDLTLGIALLKARGREVDRHGQALLGISFDRRSVFSVALASRNDLTGASANRF